MLLVTVPVYVYVEPPWRALVARLAAALVLGVALLQLRRALAERARARRRVGARRRARRRGAPSPACPTASSTSPATCAPPCAAGATSSEVLWPRLLALTARAAAPPAARAGAGAPAWPPPRRHRRHRAASREDRRRRRAGPRGRARRSARIVVGKDDVLERILAGILANGHVLIEDYPGPRQDPHRAPAGPGARPRLPPHPVHARPAPQRHHRQLPLRPARGPLRVPGRARSSPTSCSPTRSTAPRPRRRRRCWRRCRRRR